MMARAYIPAPETLKAFPEAKRVKPKGLNRRWRDRPRWKIRQRWLSSRGVRSWDRRA